MTLLSDYVPTGEYPLVTTSAAAVPPPRMSPEEAQAWALIERAQAGDAQAFAAIYDRYMDTVFRFVYFRVGNRQVAEDLTADTFLRALRRIGSFTWQGRDIGAWLVTIARNLLFDYFKSAPYRLSVTLGDIEGAAKEHLEAAALREATPADEVVTHLSNVTLLTAVKQLNPEQRECIVLRFLQGLSVAETAAAMGKNDNAVKALQYRAVRTLARLLPDGFLEAMR
jgi:RNA polymerase sigma-70 factor, ECF subfamily